MLRADIVLLNYQQHTAIILIRFLPQRETNSKSSMVKFSPRVVKVYKISKTASSSGCLGIVGKFVSPKVFKVSVEFDNLLK